MFTFDHLTEKYFPDVCRLVVENQREAKEELQDLPQADPEGVLAPIVANGRGVVGLQGRDVVGFLGCVEPWGPQFGALLGAYIPLHGHAAVRENRGRIYAELYQAAAEKWLEEGVVSHAISLYAHDYEAVESFFWSGFGLRCVDALRPMKPLLPERPHDCSLMQLDYKESQRVLPLAHLLTQQLRASPSFLPNALDTPQDFRVWAASHGARYFVTMEGEQIVGYLECVMGGENYLCDDPSMVSISSAYLLPDYQGSGRFAILLDYAIACLRQEGYSLLGVDYECFNPQARGFWGRYFTPYTYSMTRRLDERILAMR